ncbi:aspartate carbamoyltransferase [Micromonospora deserti]|uniref:Aspartate carbamoyltransferase n=1 Tax=Micromonospora deserti TaxID=2070366 RepID=A0A2W2CV74_9ACTN|nr:aspartate carbamoyltransferase [Micromonospora deserti]PZG02473.1 aspartate carbamoyltransferase [Micromonospora deserti]
MTRHDRPRTRRQLLLAATTAAAVLSAGCADANSAPATSEASADRQAQVAERGASVMPFDLDRTTHHFRKTDTGGIQTVVADDPADTTQIGLIRQHVQHEAESFRRGDFTDPSRIHGTEMPGLAALRNSAGKIAIDYETTADGARITYTTPEDTLITALHAWFDAQLSDHGQHATPQ